MEDNQEPTTYVLGDELRCAVEVVKKAIKAKKERYNKIASTNDENLVLLEGKTNQGFYCQLMVDPKEVAEIYLKYNYHIWSILEEEPPAAMWDELAYFYGLKSVSEVDL